MKNSKLIIGFIIGAILASGITAYATSYFARDIAYTEDKSVAIALDELYERSKNYQVTKIDPSSRGVFNIPNGVTTAYIMFLNATSGNQEYTFYASGDIITSGPTVVSSTSAIDTSLWSALILYKVELTGNPGTITCTATGATGNQKGYQFAMFY